MFDDAGSDLRRKDGSAELSIPILSAKAEAKILVGANNSDGFESNVVQVGRDGSNLESLKD